MRILGDRVLIALPPKEHEQEAATGYTYQAGKTTDSGLILAKPADTYNIDIATRGIVMQIGEKTNTVDLDAVIERVRHLRKACEEYDADGKATRLELIGLENDVRRLGPAPFDVQVGDCVLFAPSSGQELSKEGIDYVILHESEILAIVEPKAEAA